MAAKPILNPSILIKSLMYKEPHESIPPSVRASEIESNTKMNNKRGQKKRWIVLSFYHLLFLLLKLKHRSK